MPLSKRTGPAARSNNIQKLIKEGRDPRQAVAISYSVQERNQQRERAKKHAAKRAGK